MFNQEKFLCLGMLSSMNMFFHIKRVEDNSNETDSPNIHDQNIFTEDQPILNQPSQVIFTPCDNIENNVNNDHESDI